MKKKFAYWRTSSSHISAYQQLNCEKWPEYKILQRLDLMVWEGLLQLCCSPKYVANMFYEKCHWLQPKLQLIRNTGSTYHNSVKVCAVQGARWIIWRPSRLDAWHDGLTTVILRYLWLTPTIYSICLFLKAATKSCFATWKWCISVRLSFISNALTNIIDFEVKFRYLYLLNKECEQILYMDHGRIISSKYIGSSIGWSVQSNFRFFFAIVYLSECQYYQNSVDITAYFPMSYTVFECLRW